MKSIYYLAIALFICLLYSCSGSNTKPSQQSMIIGKWTQQQQHNILTINGVKIADTTITAGSDYAGNINFFAAGTFTSAGYYYFPTGLPGQASPSLATTDSTSGVFNFNNNLLTLNAPIAGFPGPVHFITNNGSAQPTLTLISHSAKIIQLTSTVLTLQTEYISSAANTLNPGTYDYLNVYYFTR